MIKTDSGEYVIPNWLRRQFKFGKWQVIDPTSSTFFLEGTKSNNQKNIQSPWERIHIFLNTTQETKFFDYMIFSEKIPINTCLFKKRQILVDFMKRVHNIGHGPIGFNILDEELPHALADKADAGIFVYHSILYFEHYLQLLPTSPLKYFAYRPLGSRTVGHLLNIINAPLPMHISDGDFILQKKLLKYDKKSYLPPISEPVIPQLQNFANNSMNS